jgi:hypothetical protein
VNRKPLVLDDAAQTQQLQPGDKLDPDAAGVPTVQDFIDLQNNFRSLLLWMSSNGFNLPDNLILEVEKYLKG